MEDRWSSPRALQLMGFRLDKGLLLPALPGVTAGIFPSSAPLRPCGLYHQLRAAPQNRAKSPGALGAGEVDGAGMGRVLQGKCLKIHHLLSGEGAGMGLVPFGKPDHTELGANACFNVIAARGDLVSPQRCRCSKRWMRRWDTPSSAASVCTGQPRLLTEPLCPGCEFATRTKM